MSAVMPEQAAPSGIMEAARDALLMRVGLEERK
jgi:hypothetical protein